MIIRLVKFLSSDMQVVNESSLVLSILEEQRLVVCNATGGEKHVMEVCSDSVTKVYYSSFTRVCDYSEMALSAPITLYVHVYVCILPGHS